MKQKTITTQQFKEQIKLICSQPILPIYNGRFESRLMSLIDNGKKDKAYIYASRYQAMLNEMITICNNTASINENEAKRYLELLPHLRLIVRCANIAFVRYYRTFNNLDINLFFNIF